MAFGMMVNKWGILQRPVSVPLDKLKWMIVCIATLHNFCINERITDTSNRLTGGSSCISDETMLDEQELQQRRDFADLEYETYKASDISTAGSKNRERMKRDIIALKLQRPKINHSKAG
jgi:hypothetical protein